MRHVIMTVLAWFGTISLICIIGMALLRDRTKSYITLYLGGKTYLFGLVEVEEESRDIDG